MTAPVAAAADRTKPDFSSMTIGDGYQDLPTDEETSNNAEETSEEETESEEETSEETSE